MNCIKHYMGNHLPSDYEAFFFKVSRRFVVIFQMVVVYRPWPCHQRIEISSSRSEFVAFRLERSRSAIMEHPNRSVHCHFRWCWRPQRRSPERGKLVLKSIGTFKLNYWTVDLGFWFRRQTCHIVWNGPLIEALAAGHGSCRKSHSQFLHFYSE